MTDTPKPSPRIISDEPIIIDKPATEGILGSEYDDKVTAVAELIEHSFGEHAPTRLIGIFGPWGSGKNSFVRMAIHRLPRHQELEFRPTSYDNETEVAAALFRACLEQLSVEAKGLERLWVKARLWWHNTGLRHGMVNLIGQLLVLGARVMVLVVLPALVSLVVLSGELRTVVASAIALLGGSTIIGERIKKAMEPGLNIDASEFLRQIRAGSTTSELDAYVQEFRWIATLARSNRNPFVIVIDRIDVGLPLQGALILETLRTFHARDIPCAFVFLAEDATSLRTAVRMRFINELCGDDTGGLTEGLLRMADAYLDRLFIRFDLAGPTAAEHRQALESLSDKTGTSSVKEPAD
jgi:hypothetical protein